MTTERGGRGPLAPAGILARNTIWNLAGMVLPAAAALAAIPPLIGRLGDARFGVLTLAWGLAVLFALSDLGLARATTNLLARAWADGTARDRSGFIWASLLGHAVLGLAAGGLFALFTPWMVTRLLDVPADLQVEASRAFYLLALSIPFVLTGNPLRSVLETTQQFGVLNAVRIPSSILNYLGPLAFSAFTVRLEAIVGVIVATRVVGLVAFAWLAVREAPALFQPTMPSRGTTRMLIRTGGWLGATGFALPAVASLDRIIIGARLSVADVGYYAAPYEVVTKLWFLSGSLLLVLYPVFSALNDGERLQRAYQRAIRYLFVPVVIAAAGVLAFASEAFSLWLGRDFGAHAAPVARWLAVGVVLSVVGQVPMTLLQCRGRPEVPAVVHLIEVPAYALLAWLAAGQWGIAGVAMAWAVRAAGEALVMFVAASRLEWSARVTAGGVMALVFVGAGALAVAQASAIWLDPVARALVVGLEIVVIGLWSWATLFDSADKALLDPRQIAGAIRGRLDRSAGG